MRGEVLRSMCTVLSQIGDYDMHLRIVWFSRMAVDPDQSPLEGPSYKLRI